MSDQTPGAPQDPQQPAQPPVPPPAQPPAAPAQPPAQPPVEQQAPPPAAPQQQYAPPPVPPQQQYAPPPAQPGAQPGAPVPPPPGYTPAAAAPPPAGGLFKSGQTKTIALIVGGVVAVGIIGGVAALLAGGGGDDKEDVSTTASAPEGSGVLDPAPVGNTDPAEPSDEEPADPESPPPTEEPEPEPEPAPEPPPVSGDAVTIGGDIAVPVPSGWQVLGAGENDVALSDGAKNYVYAITGQVDPSADAGEVLRNTMDTVVPPDQYPDLRTSDVIPQTPGGSIVSLALLEYEGTWTDGQGTTPVHGAIFSAVRQDGTALVILGEHTPPKEFADIWASELQPVVDGILLPFAGLG